MPENIGYQFNRLYAAPIETYRQVNTITNRNAIPAEIRWEGMECYVVTENQDYQLVGGVDNSNWVNAGETVSNPTTHFKGFFNATTVTPAISNLNGIEGDEYKVTNGGVNVDFGAGDVFLETDDILIFYQSQWRVKVRPGLGGTLTANRALLSDASGKVDVSDITSTELGYLDNVTSNIQTQLNAKLATSSYTAGDVLTKLLTVDGSGSGLDADLLRGVHWGNVNTNIITSANIAIGTSTPVTSVGFGNLVLNGTTGGQIIFRQADVNKGFCFTSNNNMSIGTQASGFFQLFSNNLPRITIQSSGNVSIGNINDTYKLDVSGTGRFTGTAIAAPATLSTELVTKGQLDAAARPYKVYTALLTQAGTGDPTATVLENTLGGTIVWTRGSEGVYTATLSISGFTENKTICFCTASVTTTGALLRATRASLTTVSLSSQLSAGVPRDVFSLLNIEIRVYL